MPRRSARVVWIGRVGFVVIVAGLATYLVVSGLDKADKVASSLGVLLASIALVAPYLLPSAKTAEPAGPPAAPSAHASGPGSVAVAGSVVNSTITTLVGGSFLRLADARLATEAIFEDVNVKGFAGRQWLIRQIEEFLHREDRGHLIVEAEAGVGKTALAAALVSGNAWPGHFTRNAGGRGSRVALANLAAQLIPACGLESDWARGDGFVAEAATPGWFEALLQAAVTALDGRRLVIVVDGLDEAEQVDGAMPLGLPRTLPPNVYLILTCRTGTEYLPPTGPSQVLRIESTSDDNLRDMRRFLDGRITTEPLAGRLHRTGTSPGEFADLLVERCGGIWVYLRYVLEEIGTDRRPIDDLRTLPHSLAGYYLEKLQAERRRPDWARLYRPLLATLAVAGEPLPLDRLAALAGLPDEEVVRRFCHDYWRPFLTVRGPSRPRLYGIYHASLRDFLLGAVAADDNGDRAARAADELAEAAVESHRRFVDVLSAEVPIGPDGRRDWAAADSYTVRHLIAHAAAAARDASDHRTRVKAMAVRDELLGDVECVLHAEPYSLSGTLGNARNESAHRVARAYRISYGLHRQLDVHGRRRVFAMDAARLGDLPLAARASAPDPDGWRPRWATGSRTLGALRLTIDAGDSDISTLSCAAVGMDPVAVTSSDAGGDGLVHAWNLLTGEQIGTFPGGTLAQAAGCVEIDGEAVTVVATGRMLRMWNLATDEISLLAAEKPAAASAVATMVVDGVPTAIAALGAGDLYVWDLTRPGVPGRLLGRHTMPDGGPLDGVSSVTGAQVGGRPVVIVVGGARGSVWDLRTGAELHDGFTYYAEESSIGLTRAAVLEAGDRTLVVVSHDHLFTDAALEVFDAGTGAGTNVIFAGKSAGSIATALVAGVPHVFAIDDLDGLMVRNFEDSWRPSHRLPLEFSARSLNCTTIDGCPVIVIAGTTRTAGQRGFTSQIKLFDAAGVVRAAEEPQPPSIFSATTADHARILAGSVDGSVHRFDADTGARTPCASGDSPGRVYPLLAIGDTAISAVLDGPLQRWSIPTARAIGEPFRAHPGRVYAMTTVSGLVVTGQDCAELHFWDPATGTEARPSWEHGHGSGGVNALASFELDGEAVLATGGSADGKIRFWRQQDGTQRGRAVDAHGLMVGVLAPVTIDGRTLLVSGGGMDGRINVWDPLSGARLCGPVTTNRMGVQAIVPARFRGTPALLTGGYYSTEVGIWSLRTGERLGALPVPSPVNGILFGPDAQLVIQTEQDLIAMAPPPFLRPWTERTRRPSTRSD